VQRFSDNHHFTEKEKLVSNRKRRGKRQELQKEAAAVLGRANLACRNKGVGKLAHARHELLSFLSREIIGQEEAIGQITRGLIRSLSPLRDKERPLLSSLMVGPTGVGKSETARALARVFFGQGDAMVRIDCGEYQQGHEIAKILGSPPGYVGSDITPLLSEGNLSRPYSALRTALRNGQPWPSGISEEVISRSGGGAFAIVLVDEVEKAHPDLWRSLLGALDYGHLRLGNNKDVDMTQAVILMTSNTAELALNKGKACPLGFAADEGEEEKNSFLKSEVMRFVSKTFPPEFLNRLDITAFYKPLSKAELAKIFDKIMGGLHDRLLQSGFPVLVQVTRKAKELVLRETLERERGNGARGLRRMVDQMIGDPLADLIIQGDVFEGSQVNISLKRGEIFLSVS